jgi:hypothetical protein
MTETCHERNGKSFVKASKTPRENSKSCKNSDRSMLNTLKNKIL